MREIKGQTIENQTILMDDTCFIECKVSNCTLIYCGGPHIWIDSTFDNCIMRFDSVALNTIRYLNVFGKLTETFSKEMGIEPTVDPAKKILEDEINAARTTLINIQARLNHGYPGRTAGGIEEMIQHYFTKGASGLADGSSL